jgi:TIR domain
MHWQIEAFPRCTHHVFLSHCREDRNDLVFPLRELLRANDFIPWLDQHDYPTGHASFEALRHGILRCRHVVFLVTENMLNQPRGWGIVELAWAELLQENLRVPGGVLQIVALPLVFVQQNHEGLLRSAWKSVHDRAEFFDTARDADRVEWAFRKIFNFVASQEELGADYALLQAQDPLLSDRLQFRAGLLDRVTARYPPHAH